MKRLCVENFQKMRFDRGCIVYNTNNYRFGIVMNGKLGTDADPCSEVWEKCSDNQLLKHSPPNRAFIPTGRFVDVEKILIDKISQLTTEATRIYGEG